MLFVIYFAGHRFVHNKVMRETAAESELGLVRWRRQERRPRRQRWGQSRGPAGDTPPTQPPRLQPGRAPGGAWPSAPSPGSGWTERLSQEGRARWGRAPPWASGPHPVSRLSSWLPPAPRLTPLPVLPSHPVPPTAAPLPFSLSPSSALPPLVPPHLWLPECPIASHLPSQPPALPPSGLPRNSATPLASLLLIAPHRPLRLRDHSCGSLLESPPPRLPLPEVPGLPPHPLPPAPLLRPPDPGKPREDVQRVTRGPGSPG